jgi:ABC-type Co2+ transport system permease subunit
VLFLASLVHVPLGPSSIHLTLLGLAGLLLGWSAIPALFVALLLQGFLLQFGGLLSLGVNTTIMGTAALSGYALYSLIYSLIGRIPAYGGDRAFRSNSPATQANSASIPCASGSVTHERSDGVVPRDEICFESLNLRCSRSVPCAAGSVTYERNDGVAPRDGICFESQNLRCSRSVPCVRKRPAVIYAAAFIAGFLAIIVGSLLVIIALALSDMNLKTIAALIFAANLPLALVEGAITVFIVSFLSKLYPRALKL